MGEGKDMGDAARPQARSAGYDPVEPQGETHPEAREPEAAHPSDKSAEGVHEASEHSIWPFVLACGLLLIGIGAMGQLPIIAAGAFVALVAIVGWMWQPWTS